MVDHGVLDALYQMISEVAAERGAIALSADSDFAYTRRPGFPSRPMGHSGSQAINAAPRRTVLDTSVLIDPRPAQEISKHAGELTVQVTAIGELQYGVTGPTQQTEGIQNILEQFLVLAFNVCSVMTTNGEDRAE